MARAKSKSPNVEVPILTFNGKDYVVSELPEEAQQQYINVKAAETEINRLKMQLAFVQTAYNAYRQSLIAAVPNKD